jgi:FtsP/CotA-like multicopper oxidase with cupredoxin domain
MVQPLNVHRLEIAVAQRYSVILTANQSATNYWIRSQMNTYCFAIDNPVLDPDVRALLTYTNTTTAPTASSDWSDQLDLVCEDLNTTALIPTVSLPPPPASTVYAVTVGFDIGAYALDRAYINGTSWTAPTVPTLNQALTGLSSPNTTISTAFTHTGVSSAFSANQYVISIPTPTTIDLLITNFDDGAHPFHLHGHMFWIMATGTEQYFDWSTYADLNNGKGNGEAMRRDTLTIDEYGWALIRFTSANAGMWALHCHISWHMEAGLLMQFMAREDVMRDWELPSDVAGLCTS